MIRVLFLFLMVSFFAACQVSGGARKNLNPGKNNYTIRIILMPSGSLNQIEDAVDRIAGPFSERVRIYRIDSSLPHRELVLYLGKVSPSQLAQIENRILRCAIVVDVEIEKDQE